MGDNLEELWISYNGIEKLKGITVLKKLKVNHQYKYLNLIEIIFKNFFVVVAILKVLYMSNNMVKDWGEFSKLVEN